MKNTLENKAKFFAQYWGQNILRWHQWKDSNEYSIVNFQVPMQSRVGIDKGWYLELKPLEQISDEDAHKVGTLVNCWSKSERKMEFFQDDELKDTHIMAGQSFANAIDKEYGYGHSHPFANNSTDILNAFDYLRSKGYAFSWNGITVEEQIEFGWIKLKTN